MAVIIKYFIFNLFFFNSFVSSVMLLRFPDTPCFSYSPWWRHQMETFLRYWPFVRGSPPKGQWRGALMFSLIFAWINGSVNKREAGDWRRHRAHYDLNVMSIVFSPLNHINGRTPLVQLKPYICEILYLNFFYAGDVFWNCLLRIGLEQMWCNWLFNVLYWNLYILWK